MIKADYPNIGQPCGGTTCAGRDPDLCQECEAEAEKFERERWKEYYSMIGPLERY